ncbi:(R)-specific enoyl-CoA hydratase [wastewater metagenome]|uniref:(R)-specific enoyl-CoA hydratase n=2 Tax=unclassified sequences TaxID=12908 RepID=A0A5B8RDQ3_9ZZZZ|nr:MaoC family dehydratase [Arhodomonas aquaeolei]MCS4505581.1 MaoC family dehydratase [Arhodomonas aquaeolei]QEA06028.1 (R)-specific enoyl-CoA hydratase [uncultured organism]
MDGYCLEDLSEGMTARLRKTVTEADIGLFAGVTGDFNPLHVDAEYAGETPFGGRIAHGMLTAGLVSAVLGTRLPGPGSIYVSQSMRFRAPVYPGDTVTAEVEVLSIERDRGFVTLETRARVGTRAVLSGEAVLKTPSRSDMQ